MDFCSIFQRYDLPNHGVRLPEITISPEEKTLAGAPADCDNFEFLRALCRKGFKDKILNKIDRSKHKEYGDRVKEELETFKDLGFIDYVLLVWKVVSFAKAKNIPVGPGRGSVCGSLVFYLIDVTKIDSIKYDLYFARFISKIRARKKVVDGVTYVDGSLMPDVDTDFCFYKRDEILEYINSYFKGRTSKILTFQTLSSKIVLKECLKAIEKLNEDDAKNISDLITRKHGILDSIQKELKKNDLFAKWATTHKFTIDIAQKLQDLFRARGQHPSAILVSHDIMEDTIPVETVKNEDDHSVVASYDMYSSQDFAVKLDILALRTMTLIDEVCKNNGIMIEDIDVNDPAIYDYFQNNGNYYGLFQIESESNGNACRKVKPENINELGDILAICRPGAMSFINQYYEYKRKGIYNSIHPIIDEVLRKTAGVCLYQEQIMALFVKIGFSLEDAEMLRRDIGKKKVDKIPEWKEKIYKNCEKNDFPKEVADLIWKICEDSAGYQFNLSHSTSYANLTAITTYLKVKYTQDFFLSCLKMSLHESDCQAVISQIASEMKWFGMELLPPHIMGSGMDFQKEGKDIRFGLSAIKGVAEKSIEKILAFKKDFANKFEVFQSAKQAKLPIGILSAMIQAGCLSHVVKDRSRLVFEAQLWNILTEKERKLCFDLGAQFGFDLLKVLNYIKTLKTEKGKPVLKESRLETIRKRYAPYYQIYKTNSAHEEFSCYYYERLILGFSYSTTLYKVFSAKNPNLNKIIDIAGGSEDDRFKFVGEVIDVKSGTAKNEKGTKYLKLIVGDELAKTSVMLFNDNIKKHERDNMGIQAEEGNIVYVSGRKKGDAIFADSVSVQEHKVYTKLSQLKEEK